MFIWIFNIHTNIHTIFNIQYSVTIFTSYKWFIPLKSLNKIYSEILLSKISNNKHFAFYEHFLCFKFSTVTLKHLISFQQWLNQWGCTFPHFSDKKISLQLLNNLVKCIPLFIPLSVKWWQRLKVLDMAWKKISVNIFCRLKRRWFNINFKLKYYQ